MAQRQQERTAPTTRERAEEDSEEGSTTEEDNEGRGRVAVAVGDVGEIPAPSTVGNATGEGEGGIGNNLRTAIEAIQVG